MFMTLLERETLLNKISQAYSDPQVKKIKGLDNDLLKYAEDINKGKNIGEISYKLSTTLSKYILQNQFKLPKSIIELQTLVSKKGQIYRGWGSIGIWS